MEINIVYFQCSHNLTPVRGKIIKEAKRVLKYKLIIVEWDMPKKLIQKLLFGIINILEPKGFNDLLQLNIKEYVERFSLKVLSE